MKREHRNMHWDSPRGIISGKLPTYPSPKPTFCPKREVSVNVGLGQGRGRWAVSQKRIMIIAIEYSLFQRISLEEAANKRPRGLLPMMAFRGRLHLKGVSFSRKMVSNKGKGLDPGAEPPRKNIC